MRNNQTISTSIDWLTVVLYLIFVLAGWMNIYASSYNEEAVSMFNLDERAGKQLLWIGFALFMAIVILIIDSKFYEAFAYPIYGAVMILLVVVLVVGSEIKGSKSWIAIGSFSLQPAEFMKFATALAVAKILSDFHFRFSKMSDFLLVFSIALAPLVLILLQNDTGSALVYFSLVLVMFREGLSGIFLVVAVLGVVFFILSILMPVYVLLLIVLAVPAIYLILKRLYRDLLHMSITVAAVSLVLYVAHWMNLVTFTVTLAAIASALFVAAGLVLRSFLVRKPIYLYAALFLFGSFSYILSTDYIFHSILGDHQRSRIEVLVGLKDDPKGAGYNVAQSQIAIGSGGFAGKGFLQGTQTKYDFVPEQSTDFIFCTIGEEWGFLGSFTLIVLFGFFLIRILFMAERQRSAFSRIYGYGVFSILFFHFAINIGMTIGLAPVIGIPLPFFSYGGSSLWGFTILLFIFLRLDSNRLQILG
jgi:rod shape determining protein RodA